MEKSSVLFQEVVAMLLGSESIRHVDFSDVLSRATPPATPTSATSSSGNVGCEIIPPIILLIRSLQSRCKSIILSGNCLDQIDVSEICKCRHLELCCSFVNANKVMIQVKHFSRNPNP